MSDYRGGNKKNVHASREKRQQQITWPKMVRNACADTGDGRGRTPDSSWAAGARDTRNMHAATTVKGLVEHQTRFGAGGRKKLQ